MHRCIDCQQYLSVSRAGTKVHWTFTIDGMSTIFTPTYTCWRCSIVRSVLEA